MDMKRKPFLVLLVALLGAALTLPAHAGGRGHYGGHYGGRYAGHYGGGWGIYLGLPLGWPGWYYPSYNYPPYYSSPMVVESQPQTYIERGDIAEDAGEPFYWYHCDKPRGYHPYIEKCPGGWKKVVPTPPTD
jgi:hypothetical protein